MTCIRYVCEYHCVFVFNDTATTEIYTYRHTLSLHDALPISDHQPLEAAELVAAWERNDASRLRCLWQREFLSRLCVRMATPDVMKAWTVKPSSAAATFSTSTAATSNAAEIDLGAPLLPDRKSTRLNSSH